MEYQQINATKPELKGSRTLGMLITFIAGLSFGVMADTILVAENFGGAVDVNLSGKTADTYHADLSASGGSSTWGGSANVKQAGNAYGNNCKVVYLNLGSYIDDSKGTADGLFELRATLNLYGDQRGNGYNFLSFANTSSPAPAVNTHAIGSIGINRYADVVADTVGPGLSSVLTTNTVAGAHDVTIALDLTPAFYDGSSTFGKITLSDSSAGVLGTATLTSDQSFAAISFLVEGTLTGSRTDSIYSALTLNQITPEPAKGTLFVFE